MFNRLRRFLSPLEPNFRLLWAACFLIVLAGRLDAQNGCMCTNCPQTLPDNFAGDFYIQVQNAANPVLGQNGQGVCGVVLHFDHEFIGDLIITLTSPAGQTVTLTGPTGFFGETDGTDWDITFVPCNATANPDPGFSATWTNDQIWGIFGNYSGSYYPYSGCLGDFNSGPVNGQWTLSVEDQLPNDAGNFYDYQILFCDPTNIECYSCEANAGNLLQADTSYCAGDTALQLKLKPTYAAPQTPPPAAAYSYTYVVGSGGVIVAYEPGPDLSAYPPGMYTICGLSYLTKDTTKIPAPDSTLTITQLTAQLNSSNPPFCGKITTNCLNITILPLPDNIVDTAVICAPECFVYHDTSFCKTGVYAVELIKNSCPYTATFYLTVLQPVKQNIYENICPGACAKTPGFQQYCSTGEYSATFPGANGCDSIVTLHLTVLDAVASVAQPQALSCSQTAVPLLGTGSTLPGSGVSYLWSASDGGSLNGPVDLINAEAASAGAYLLTVCKTIDTLSCCDTAAVVVVANQNAPAVPGGINGPTLICNGQSADFQVEPAQYASAYTWTLPPGVMLNTGQGSESVMLSWTTDTGGDICVTAENACGTSAPVCLPVDVLFAPPAPVLIGPDTLCAGSQGFYSAAPVPGAKGYEWEISGGTILGQTDSSLVEVIWNTQDSIGSLCARAVNDCGTGPSHCIDVRLIIRPKVQAGVDSAVCGNILRLNGESDMPAAAGVWTLISGSGAAVFSDSTDAGTTVKVNQPGSYIFRWAQSNGNCMAADSILITFRPLPVFGPPVYTCDAANEYYSAMVAFTGGTGPYSVNGLQAGANQYVSGLLPSGSSYNLLLVDSFGCSATLTDSFACDCITFAGVMSDQLLQACDGQTVNAQHLGGQILDGNDAVIFLLHTNPGDSIGQTLAWNTSGAFGFQPGMTFDSVYYISFVAGNNSNGYPDITDPCLSVAPGQPVVFRANPVAFAGVDTAICGDTYVLNAGSGNGQWSFSTTGPAGAVSISNIQDAQSTVKANLPGTYLLKWTVAENGCYAFDEVNIRFNDFPVITDTVLLCDSINENYTVHFRLSGGAPPYRVNGTNWPGDLFESAPVPSGATYNFIVSDSNHCTLPPITGDFVCNCKTYAGTMHHQPVVACSSDTIQAVSNNDYILDGNDIAEYVLHSGDGSALGQVWARNKTGRFTFIPGMQFGQPYYVSLVAGNPGNGSPDPGDPCFAVAPGQQVRFLEQPDPDAGPDRATCGQETQLELAGSSFPGIWTLQAGPGTVDFDNADSAFTSAKVATTGVYTFRWTAANGQCAAFDELTVTFHGRPMVENLKEDCNGTNTGFTVTFSLTGGTPPFKVDGLNGLLNGPVFLSLNLTNNLNYSFTVTDANGCATPPVSGYKNCLCSTFAGSMSTVPVFFCPDQPVAAIWNNDAVMDADDKVQFILHDAPGASLGNILAIRDQPEFPFSANTNLQTGYTYYISAIAGNNVGGSVDFQDPCLSVVPGTPVQWKPAPVAAMSGDTTVCAGQKAALRFTGTGVFPLNVYYHDASGGAFVLALTNPQLQEVMVTPLSTTTYSLLQVTDGKLPVCTTKYDTVSVTIVVNEPAEAGETPADVEICENDASIISLADLLQGAQNGGIWLETSDQLSSPGAFDATQAQFHSKGQAPGVYQFQYRVKGQAPCSNDSVTATIRIHPAPVAAAGPDILLDCDLPEQWLGDAVTTKGPGINYQWLFNGVAIDNSNAWLWLADTAGTYTLRVSNQYGCSDTDAAQVGMAAPPLAVPGLRIIPIRCFGENNGIIRIDSVSGGTPPLRFALGNGVFGPNREFSDLRSGAYVIRVQDAAGCEWTSDSLVMGEPPEIKIDLGDQIQAALGDSVYLWVESSVPPNGLDTVIWTPLLDTSAQGRFFQRFLPLNSGTMRVKVVDTSGCFQEDEVLWLVNRERRVYFPNIFKPGSGSNAIFYVSGGNDVKEVEVLQIFDRWGECVFSAQNFQPEDPNYGWAGRYREAEAGEGVYTFYAVIRFVDGEREIFSGNVTLLR